MVDELAVPGEEIAEKGPEFERVIGEPHGVRNRATLAHEAHEVADDDLLIEREDLGPESATFVAAGSPIPRELADLPRRPARGAPRKR